MRPRTTIIAPAAMNTVFDGSEWMAGFAVEAMMEMPLDMHMTTRSSPALRDSWRGLASGPIRGVTATRIPEGKARSL